MVLSDKELEATGNSWLKSSNPLCSAVVPNATLPSISENKLDSYSRDSLDLSGHSKNKNVAFSDDSSAQLSGKLKEEYCT